MAKIDHLMLCSCENSMSLDPESARAAAGAARVSTASSLCLNEVDAVASAFGLNCWHLIMPSLPDELVSSSSISDLYSNYLKAGPDGRELIEHIAKREATGR